MNLAEIDRLKQLKEASRKNQVPAQHIPVPGKTRAKSQCLKPIVLIACGKTKAPLARTQPVPASQLYTGAMFRKAWKYALMLTVPDNIYILSAKHGLVKHDTPLRYYDKTLVGATVTEKKEWAQTVLGQMRQNGIDPSSDQFIFLAGRSYTSYLTGHGACEHYELPYDGLGGMGYILQFLDQKIK